MSGSGRRGLGPDLPLSTDKVEIEGPATTKQEKVGSLNLREPTFSCGAKKTANLAYKLS